MFSCIFFFSNLKSEIINIPSIGDDMHISFLVSRVKLLIYQNLLLYQVLVVMIFKKKKVLVMISSTLYGLGLTDHVTSHVIVKYKHLLFVSDLSHKN